MLQSLNYIPLCQGNPEKTSQSYSASRRSPSSCLSSLKGKRTFPNQKLCTEAVLAVVSLVSMKLLDLVRQMISATVEPHGELLTSKTYDTNHLWPCELNASGNETGTTLFKRPRLSLESPGAKNAAALCTSVRTKVQTWDRGNFGKRSWWNIHCSSTSYSTNNSMWPKSHTHIQVCF